MSTIMPGTGPAPEQIQQNAPPRTTATWKKQIEPEQAKPVNTIEELLAKHKVTAEVVKAHSKNEVGEIVHKILPDQSRFQLHGRQAEVYGDDEFLNALAQAEQDGKVGEFLAARFPRHA